MIIKLNSSNLDSVEYNEEKSILTVNFKRGASYNYINVPKGLYDGLIVAESCGTYFNSNIKPYYVCEKLEVDAQEPKTEEKLEIKLDYTIAYFNNKIYVTVRIGENSITIDYSKDYNFPVWLTKLVKNPRQLVSAIIQYNNTFEHMTEGTVTWDGEKLLEAKHMTEESVLTETSKQKLRRMKHAQRVFGR